MVDNRHPERLSVTLAFDLELAETWAETLEDREAKRQGRSVKEVRPDVARHTGVPTGTLYSLRRKRLKDVKHRILKRLGDALLAELHAELLRAEHDYQTYVQIGLDPRSSEVQSVLASRQRLREALGLSDAPAGKGAGG